MPIRFRLAEPKLKGILDWRSALGTAIRWAAPCLNFRSHPVIEELEARIGKPIVTSTQVALWRLLRLAGVYTLTDSFGAYAGILRMRIAIFGTGGAGGYFGAQLAHAGEDVIFIARGSHLQAIRTAGLRLDTRGARS